MALNVLRKVAFSIFDASFYTIMCDECTDPSNREQVVLCIRWINDELEPHEDFIWVIQSGQYLGQYHR